MLDYHAACADRAVCGDHRRVRYGGGDVLFMRIAIKQGVAKGAGCGAALYGAGTARVYQLGQQEGVVSSMVKMLSGVVTVILAPLLIHLLWAA